MEQRPPIGMHLLSVKVQGPPRETLAWCVRPVPPGAGHGQRRERGRRQILCLKRREVFEEIVLEVHGDHLSWLQAETGLPNRLGRRDPGSMQSQSWAMIDPAAAPMARAEWLLRGSPLNPARPIQMLLRPDRPTS